MTPAALIPWFLPGSQQRRRVPSDTSGGVPLAPAGRIPALDGLRAVSILIVLACHASVSAGFPQSWKPVLPYLLDGHLGVRVFFVISGFLITWLLLGEEQRAGRINIGAFYQRRALRILPVYVTYVLAVLLYDRARQLYPAPACYLYALTFTTGVTPLTSSPLAHTWSLSVEEQFYLLWPMTFAFCSVRTRFVVAGAVLACGPVVRLVLWSWGQQSLLTFSSLGHGDAIMCGCLAALLMKQQPQAMGRLLRCRPVLGRLLAGAAIYLVLVMPHLHWRGRQFTTPFGVTVQALAASYLLCSYATVRRGLVYKLLNYKLVAGVGVLSYSLYIWQQIFLCPPVAGREPLWWQSFPQNLLVAFAVAWLSYRVVESPFLRLKDRLSRRRKAATIADGAGDAARPAASVIQRRMAA
jgi:peptidoglycan/LPS O-acetylase OafA/YrhL